MWDSAKPEVAAGLLLCLHDNIVSLTKTNREVGCVVRHDGHEVRRNNLESVVVDHEPHVVVCSGVHESQAVPLAGLKGGLKSGTSLIIHVSSVDKAVGSCGRSRDGRLESKIIGSVL